MSMSLDGYIAGPNDEPSNPGGDGFMRRHEWIAAADVYGPPPGPSVANYPLVAYEIVRVIDTPAATHIRYRVREGST